MKLATTILCSLLFAIAGWFLAEAKCNEAPMRKHQTLSAATLPNYQTLPSITQPTVERQNKTEKEYVPLEIVVVKDTSQAPRVKNLVHKKKRTSARATIKRQGLSTPAITPDSIVNNQVCGVTSRTVRGVREEYTPDTIGPPKGSICLTVDGEVVYKRQSLRCMGDV